MRPQDDVECIRELAIRGRRGGGRGADQVPPSRLQQRTPFAHGGAEATPHAVAHDRVSDRTAHRERDPRWLGARGKHGRTHLECPRSATTPTSDRPEHCAVTNGPDQAERLERPLPRRRPMTARPPRVRILSRKPCVFFRFRLFGWNVLFTHGLLGRPGRGRGPGASAPQDKRLPRAGGRGSVRPTRAPGNACVRPVSDWERLLVGLSTAR